MNNINNMKETLSIEGQVRLVCKDKFGNVKWDTGWMKNLITSAGKAALAGLAGNVGSVSAFTYLAVGTSSTAVAVGQTALQAEITDSGLERASATVTRSTTTVTNDTLQLDKTWTATATKAVEEVGVFNASSAGVMLGRRLTGTKTVNNEETLTATYKVIFA